VGLQWRSEGLQGSTSTIFTHDQQLPTAQQHTHGQVQTDSATGMLTVFTHMHARFLHFYFPFHL